MHGGGSEYRHFTAVLERLLKRDRGSLLQLLYLDVSKVDRVLHMGFAWEAAGDVDDVRGWREPTAGALAREPDALGARELPVQAPFGR